MRKHSIKTAALFLALAALALSSCPRPAQRKPAPVQGSEGRNPVSPARRLGIRALLVEGSVEVVAPGREARPLQTGDDLVPGESLRTGAASSCDLDIGGVGRLRVQANTVLVLESAEILGASPIFRSRIESGRVMAVARALVGRESFIVETKNAICGVRGTAFSLETNGDRSLLVVADGHVAMLPQGPALAGLEKAAASNSAARGLLRAAVALAPLVGPGQELAVGSREAEVADKALAGLVAALPATGAEALPAEPLIPAEDVAGPATPPALPGLASALPTAAPADAAAILAIKALIEFAAKFRDDLAARGNTGLQAPPPPPSPAILGSMPAFVGHGVEAILKADSLLVASSSSGGLVGLTDDGRVAWRVAVTSGARPVLSKGWVYVSGPREFLAVETAGGAVVRGSALSAGARLAAYPDGVVAAAADGITFFKTGSATPSSFYPVEGGALAALSLNDKDGNILVALGSGGLAIMSPRDGSILATAPGPTSSCLLSWASTCVLAGPIPGKAASQEVVMYSLPDLKELWSKPLAFRPGADPSFGPEGVFVWGEPQLAAFSLEGQPRGILAGLSAPPLLTNGILYYGLRDGGFVAASASTLKVIAIVRLPAVLAGRPLLVGTGLRLPLADGRVLSLDPGRMGK